MPFVIGAIVRRLWCCFARWLPRRTQRPSRVLIQCPACGRWIDMRKLDEVLDHEWTCGMSASRQDNPNQRSSTPNAAIAARATTTHFRSIAQPAFVEGGAL